MEKLQGPHCRIGFHYCPFYVRVHRPFSLEPHKIYFIDGRLVRSEMKDPQYERESYQEASNISSVLVRSAR